MYPLLLDLDGVLTDFVKGYSLLANDMYGTKVIDTVGCRKFAVSEAIELTPHQDIHVWEVAMTSGNFWRGLEPLVTKDTLNLVAGREDVIYCTSRPNTQSIRMETREWLNKHYLLQPCLHVPRKDALVAAWPTGGAILDDDPRTVARGNQLSSALGTFDKWDIRLMERPYNKSSEWPSLPSLPSVESLEMFLKTHN